MAVRIRVKCTQMVESTSKCRSRVNHKYSLKASGIDWDDRLTAKAVFQMLIR